MTPQTTMILAGVVMVIAIFVAIVVYRNSKKTPAQ
jgi:hypothetical protein